MGRMDRAIYEFEIESLDRFYAVLKERYANLSSLGQEAQQLVDRLNRVCGRRRPESRSHSVDPASGRDAQGWLKF